MRKTLILALLLATGCSAEDGDKGSPGADGTEGATGGDGAGGADGGGGTDGANGGDGADGDDPAGWGENEFAGTVTGPEGAIEAAAVSMWLVDDHATGIGSTAIAGTVTAADGTYSIHLPDIDAANLHLLVLAEPDDGDPMYSFVYGTDISVSPGSTAVTDIISWIVQPDGERSIADYDLTEVETHTTDADAALVTAGTDLSDGSAVITQVLEDVGGDIADSSEGSWTAIAGAGSRVTTEPADAYTGDVASSYTYLTDGGGEVWDIYSAYAYVSDGSDNAYDGYGYMVVDDNLWVTEDFGTYEDDDEMVLGPEPFSGLDITRKFYVSPTESYLRFMEVLSNGTASDITVDLYIGGSLGSGETNDLFDYTSSGDDTPDPTDTWAVNHQAPATSVVGFIFPGAVPTKSAANVYFTWNEVTVPAGSEVTLIHWAIQDTGGTAADMAADLGAAVDATTGAPNDPSWYGGLSTDNIFDNVVAIASHTVMGEAGAVAPFSGLTFTNTTSGGASTVTAEWDGSFVAAIGTETGDSVELSCTDGSTGTFVVP
jgi:hypothetical protein